MIDERHIELIQADLDGELSPEQRAELARVLLANPDARALRDELSRLFGTLSKLEDAAPPPGLASSVLSAIRWPDQTRRSQISGGWNGRAALRYAAVFVGGVLTSAAIFQLGEHGATGPEIAQLVGTIGGEDAATQQSLVDVARLELDQVSGTIRSWNFESQPVLELDLHAREPIELVAIRGDQTVRFSLDARRGADPGRVLWMPAFGGPAEASIRVQVFSGGQLLAEDMLRIGAISAD